jgi:hypothetical protein
MARTRTQGSLSRQMGDDSPTKNTEACVSVPASARLPKNKPSKDFNRNDPRAGRLASLIFACTHTGLIEYLRITSRQLPGARGSTHPGVGSPRCPAKLPLSE